MVRSSGMLLEAVFLFVREKLVALVSERPLGGIYTSLGSRRVPAAGRVIIEAYRDSLVEDYSVPGGTVSHLVREVA